MGGITRGPMPPRIYETPGMSDGHNPVSEAEFEAWMASSNYPEIADIALERLPDGTYKSQLTFAAWQAWQGAHNNMHSTLTEETARLKERVRVLEDTILAAERCNDSPASFSSAVDKIISPVADDIRRARSALHTTPEVGG